MQFGNTNMAQQSSKTLLEVVDRLCHSFELQKSSYTHLWEITKKATGTLALSRGDFTSLLSVMQEKEGLLNQINIARNSIGDDIQFWQENKSDAPTELADRLNANLDAVQVIIKRFLTAEKQLEKQINFYQKAQK